MPTTMAASAVAEDAEMRAQRSSEATTTTTTRDAVAVAVAVAVEEGLAQHERERVQRAPDDEALLRELYTRWPGRRRPIEALMSALGDARDDHPPMYVHGPPVTGKTSIVRDALRASGRAHAYASCATEHSPKLLYEAIVEELREVFIEHSTVLRDATAEQRKKALKCDRFSDLVEILKAYLPSAPSAPATYVVIDGAQRLLQWRGEQVLNSLLHLAELSCRKVIVIFIGEQGWDTFCSTAGPTPYEGVYFPAYTSAELRYILLQERPDSADESIYSAFLGTMLSTFTATCRNLHELRATLEPLWTQYVKPYDDAKASCAPLPEPRSLYAALNTNKKGLSTTANNGGGRSGQPQDVTNRRERPNVHTGLTVPLSPAALALGRGEWPVPHDTVGSGAGGRLDFEIPRLTKFLLVSAYMCSHNSEDVDKRLFGGQIEGHVAARKRKDRNAGDRERERAAEAAVDGRRVFKLERLIACFHFITRQAYDEDGAEVADLEEELLSADVFMQISSMTQLGMLSINRGSAMEGGLYQCNISRDLATKLAQNLGVNLNAYLKYV